MSDSQPAIPVAPEPRAKPLRPLPLREVQAEWVGFPNNDNDMLESS